MWDLVRHLSFVEWFFIGACVLILACGAVLLWLIVGFEKDI